MCGMKKCVPLSAMFKNKSSFPMLANLLYKEQLKLCQHRQIFHCSQSEYFHILPRSPKTLPLHTNTHGIDVTITTNERCKKILVNQTKKFNNQTKIFEAQIQNIHIINTKSDMMTAERNTLFKDKFCHYQDDLKEKI